MSTDVPGAAPAAATVEEVLPVPATTRWQPLRLGLVDLFYYDDEQFWFHDGRLLLRGNNGTGKSKVLALTLPFLLDGDIRPFRVEPDADPKKRMEWNLLLGGEHPSPERTGYAWVEFGRRGNDGHDRFVTLGIGLKAAAGRGIVKQWYFTTSRRIGDLRLVDEQIVSTRERLREELGDQGQVYETQEVYRRAVDELLFGLGEERYRALIDLLIQLRQPQLSKKPDERALAAALTEALRPVDQAIIADVAESFRSLEEERVGVVEAKETLGAAEAFLRHYREYAKVASRRHAGVLRVKHSEYEHAGRDLSRAQEAYEAAQADVVRLEAEQTRAQESQSALRGREEALQADPRMRDADRLEEAGRQAREAERATAETDREAKEAAGKSERATSASADADHLVGEARQSAENYASGARRAAVEAGLEGQHDRLLADPAASDRAIARRRDEIAHVRTLIEAQRKAEEFSGEKRRLLDDRDATLTRRAEDRQAAEGSVDEAVGQYGDAVRECLVSLSEVSVADGADELAERAEDWARHLEGESPAWIALQRAADSALSRIAAERAAAEFERAGITDELGEVARLIRDLEAGKNPEPAPAPARDRAGAERSGAELWQVTDFAEAIAEPQRAGLEAALHSAGLLDAWLFPDGTVSVAGDVVVSATGPKVADSLAGALVPAPAPGVAVAPEIVQGVLERIGLGERSGAAVWVSPDGAWGAGPARGSWSKPTAEFIGASAREARRLAELDRLGLQRVSLEGRLADTGRRLHAADQATLAVDGDKARYPSQVERRLSEVHAQAEAAQREFVAATSRRDEALGAWEESAAALVAAEAELERAAEDLALPRTTDELEGVREALRRYEGALAEARHCMDLLAEREVSARRARDDAADWGARANSLARKHVELKRTSTRLREWFDELQRTVGKDVAELQRQLGETRRGLEAVEQALTRLAAARLVAAQDCGKCETAVVDLRRRREEADRARGAASDELRAFLDTGLLRIALPSLDQSTDGDDGGRSATATLAVARAVEQELQETDDSEDAWLRVQQRVSTQHTELSTQMSRYGHTASLEQRGDTVIARVSYQQVDLDVDLLAERLRADVAVREELLSAREREILENHLVNEVASHLHELVNATEAQLVAMNHELAERRMSTGMQLRVRWCARGDEPESLATAKALLVRSDATWSPEERDMIGSFLQNKIAAVREADPTGSWQEQLAQALDYRHWHTFVVERHENGRWRPASGPASGGERALTMTVPLFAAASAHYNSAGKHAPRLILLDEAFAGVDDIERAKALGLLATFDLDVVMTSEREWACYPEVPGISIVQLSRLAGIDAIGVTRWRWDGHRRERLKEVSAAARAAGDPGVPRRVTDDVPEVRLF